MTEKQRGALRNLVRQTGQKQSELIRRALDDFICRFKPPEQKDRLAMMEQARGIWKDRDDLPDFQTLRRELDRNSKGRKINGT